jgi:hypothetical protein
MARKGYQVAVRTEERRKGRKVWAVVKIVRRTSDLLVIAEDRRRRRIRFRLATGGAIGV